MQNTLKSSTSRSWVQNHKSLSIECVSFGYTASERCAVRWYTLRNMSGCIYKIYRVFCGGFRTKYASMFLFPCVFSSFVLFSHFLSFSFSFAKEAESCSLYSRTTKIPFEIFFSLFFLFFCRSQAERLIHLL